ncbi:MULE transposase domain [Sesbania bispinosa]|nr:MULE transposase domain [Sesbania bispinosa]
MEEDPTRLSDEVDEVDMSTNSATDGETNVCIERLDRSPSFKSMDYSDAFTTTEVFPTRDDLLNWARGVGRDNGFIVVIMRSDTGGIRKKKIILTLGCERSGKYRKYKNELIRKVSGTKKCECPFKLRGRPLKNGEGWKLNVVCGFHNHEVAEALGGYAYVNRLSGEEKSLIGDMTKNSVKPKSILMALKDHDEQNVHTIKQVYNARNALRNTQKDPKTEMQHLIKLMERDQYVYWDRKVDMSDVVRDIFWTHPDAIKLLSAFPTVLIIDNTYKINKHRLPLLEIVGVTSTELTFSVAFAYVEFEQIDNFVWALEKLRDLILKNYVIPQVIVTDRDDVLMNAVEIVFPNSTHLLSQSLIAKSVKAKCKLLVNLKEEWDTVVNAWLSIMESPNEAEYNERLRRLEDVCSGFPSFIEYVKNTWLVSLKEKFVTAWTNRVMHLGTTTNNSRVEVAHERMNNLLQDSKGDLCSCWDALNKMIILQHNEIKASFQKSITIVEPKFNNRFFLKLRGLVSRNALYYLSDEFEQVKVVGIDSSFCGCAIRYTHGLPCACELARYSDTGTPIPLESVHSHWKMLTFAGQGINELWSDLSIHCEIDALLKRYQELDVPGKITLKTKLRELAFPDSTSTCPPADK